MKVIFMNDKHRAFYEEQVKKTSSYEDPCRKALFYALGLTEETCRNIKRLYNFKERCIEFDALGDEWQTGTSGRVCRLAFNLYNGLHGEQDDGESAEEYTPYGLFDCGLILYMLEAVKIRYAEYSHIEE